MTAKCTGSTYGYHPYGGALTCPACSNRGKKNKKSAQSKLPDPIVLTPEPETEDSRPEVRNQFVDLMDEIEILSKGNPKLLQYREDSVADFVQYTMSRANGGDIIVLDRKGILHSYFQSPYGQQEVFLSYKGRINDVSLDAIREE